MLYQKKNLHLQTHSHTHTVQFVVTEIAIPIRNKKKYIIILYIPQKLPCVRTLGRKAQNVMYFTS